MKKIAILGATGSIGTQTIDVIRKNPEGFRIEMISGHQNVDLLYKQSQEFDIPHVVITDKASYEKARMMNFTSKLHFGVDEANKMIDPERIDLLLNALVGNVGLKSTYAAVQNKVSLALANKESLVTGGSIIMEIAKRNNQLILPVDSEHSAIFQCLRGNDSDSVERLILTASGGPFRDLEREQIRNKKAYEALKHPNWEMGRKISIDSATLVNKGLEVIEARWLLDISHENIQVVVHPQSIIHSMVMFKDTSIIAQMGTPDMRLPIHYALNYPDRKDIDLEHFNFLEHPKLTFEEPRWDAFPGLKLAYESIRIGGTMPTVYNTVNEIMVHRYLKDEIGFYDITDQIGEAMMKHESKQEPSLDEILALDRELRARHI